MSSIAPNLSQPVGNPHPSAGKLVNRVARITARRIVIALIQAVLWGITALVLLTLCVAWMDIIWQLDVTVRFYALPTVVVVAVVVLCLKAWSEIRSATPISTAKRMDQVGRTGGQILSGFELCRSTSQHAIASPQQALTVGMSGVAIDQARHRAASIDARDVAPWALLKQSLLLAVTAVAIAGLFLFSAPKAFATSWERLTNPTADTPPYSPLTFIVDPGDTTLTYGQSLEVQVEIIGGAVDAAELIISKSDQGDAQRDEQRIAMYPRDRGHWQAVVPRVKEPMRYHVTANRGRSDIYQVDVLAVPKITAIRHTTTFPEYTRLPIRQGQSPQDRVEGLFGSTVDIVIRSDRPLAGGELRVAAAGENQSESKAVTLSVGDDPDMVHGTTSIDGSAIWTVRVRGTNDVWSDEALPIEVEMLMDRPPVVRVAQPQKRSYATPNTQIPVAVVAED
ncbi:MAG: hypothetical protein KDB00_09860, partial [Planctomycetales bacterium]|nr:hypothetical protein [Planctomycetales bacterium]